MVNLASEHCTVDPVSMNWGVLKVRDPDSNMPFTEMPGKHEAPDLVHLHRPRRGRLS